MPKQASNPVEHARFLESLLSVDPATDIENPPIVDRIPAALLGVGDSIAPAKLEKILVLLLAIVRTSVYDALGAGRIDHLLPALGPALRKQSKRRISRQTAWDPEARFFCMAFDAGVLPAAAKMMRTATRRVDNVGRIAKVVAKLEIDATVLPVAREFIRTYEGAEFIDDFLAGVHALVAILAKDGADASVRAIAAFVKRAAREGNGEVEDRVGYLVRTVGTGKAAAALGRSLAHATSQKRIQKSS